MDPEIRPELAAFAKVMESRLKENANRGDWRAFNFYYLAAGRPTSAIGSGVFRPTKPMRSSNPPRTLPITP